MRGQGSILVALLLAGVGCSGGKNGSEAPEVDTTPPEAVTDLRTNSTTSTSITLNWTSPGDDGREGEASRYDLRLSLSPITAANFDSASRIGDDLVPLPPSFIERDLVEHLLPQTTYYFALKTADEVPNWSEISNVLRQATDASPDIFPPAAVTDLRVDAVDRSSITLSWTSPGDDGTQGTAFGYDIRYATARITSETFPSANVLDPSPQPQPAGATETVAIPDLEPGTEYFVVLRTADEVLNWSPLSNQVNATTEP